MHKQKKSGVCVKFQAPDKTYLCQTEPLVFQIRLISNILKVQNCCKILIKFKNHRSKLTQQYRQWQTGSSDNEEKLVKAITAQVVVDIQISGFHM